MTTDKTQFQTPGDRKRASELSRQPSQPPTEIPGYEPQRFLGSGAFGEVWVALDRKTGRQVAIKFFSQRGSVDWTLLSGEVEKLVFLSADRYVVQLLDVGWNADPPYYVMEYIENGSLDDRLSKHGTLPITEAVAMFHEVARGLSHAHGKGVLHCDLKPANVLLDQDDMPRLADFGQSRLASEHKPALGTLFYMAPEQADMDAVPDARWDVYALGSVLYCMLTGNPPHRTGVAINEIDSAADLPARLKTYREFIRSQPPAAEHRKVRGMDRSLAEIIDRCLEVHPKRRYSNVHSVIADLKKRTERRARRPLQILGLLGPLLLLAVFAIFGFQAYEVAMRDSRQTIIQNLQKASRFAAESERRSMEKDFQRLHQSILQVAGDSQLKSLVMELESDEQVSGWLDTLRDPSVSEPVVNGVRSDFLRTEKRKPLLDFINDLKNQPLPRVASWFVTDQHGNTLASDLDPTRFKMPDGKNWAYRSYFTGLPQDEIKGGKPHPPLTGPTLSAPFKSTATNTWKLAISTPVRNEGATIGVLVMTFELGEFISFNNAQVPRAGRDEYAMLIEARANNENGLVLQHPLYDDLLEISRTSDADEGRLPQINNRFEPSLVEDLRVGKVTTIRDPLGGHPDGGAYDDDWIVWAESFQPEFMNTNGPLLLAVVQRYSLAVKPVDDLGRKLLREGLTALAVFVAVSIALWYLVLRMLSDSSLSGMRSAADGDTSQSVHSRETLEMPEPPQTEVTGESWT